MYIYGKGEQRKVGVIMKSEDIVRGTINGEWLAEQVVGIIYKQGKAKMMNLLESQIPEDQKQRIKACKWILEDMLEVIGHNVAGLIEDTLSNWEQEVEFGGKLSPEEEAEARKEYKEFRNVFK